MHRALSDSKSHYLMSLVFFKETHLRKVLHYLFDKKQEYTENTLS